MCNRERLHVPSAAPWLSFTPCPLPKELAQPNWRGFGFSALHGLLVTTWHFGGKKKKKKRSNSRALIWGKGLAAVKTGKSMVSTEKRVRYTSTQQFLGDKRPAVEKRAEWLAIYWKLYAAGCVSGSRCEQIVYVAVFCRFCGLLVIVWSTVSLCHTHTERETLGIPLISSG